jgi:hypothetical protein
MFNQAGRINFRPWRQVLTTPRGSKPQPPSVMTDMVVAVDILGDSNIYPKVRCIQVFGRQGAPMRDPAIMFTARQLAEVKRVFSHASLVLRYAPLSQVVSRSVASLHLPRAVDQGELATGKSQPVFRLVAWGPRGDDLQVQRRLKRARLVNVGASLTTGLSTLLLDQDARLEPDEQLKLRLKSGTAVVRQVDGMWRVNLAQTVVQAPPMFDLRPF